MKSFLWDCIVVGGGPGGLTAALYLARFRRTCLVLDAGYSRSKLIKRSHNYPGAKRGISGPKLLEDLRQQLAPYDIPIKHTTVARIKPMKDQTFLVSTPTKRYKTKNIILATGVVDIEPELPHVKNAIKRGLIRHCAICDAYEIIDKDIAILGLGENVVNHALFLYNYTRNITIFSYCNEKFKRRDQLFLAKLGIKIVKEPITQAKTVKSKITTLITANNIYHFDTVYSTLGALVRSALAKRLNVKTNAEGYLLVDKCQQTSLQGIYAVGDVVAGLSQICVATAQAAVAAVAINKKLNQFCKELLKAT